MPAPVPDARDEGFITPAFAGLGLALVVVGAAFLMAAREDLASARAASERQAEQLRLEGRATAAALRLLQMPDQTWQSWPDGPTDQVSVEPEGRKINPLFAEHPDNIDVTQRLVGPDHVETTVKALTTLVTASPHLVRRSEIAALSRDPRWRDCAASAFSAYSQQTALTLDPAPAAPNHLGEIWRIVVTGQDGGFIDQIVRFSGDRARFIDVLEQNSGHAGGAVKTGCKRMIANAEG